MDLTGGSGVWRLALDFPGVVVSGVLLWVVVSGGRSWILLWVVVSGGRSWILLWVVVSGGRSWILLWVVVLVRSSWILLGYCCQLCSSLLVGCFYWLGRSSLFSTNDISRVLVNKISHHVPTT